MSTKVGRSTKIKGAVGVILAGGYGSRLWPISTPDEPKQFQTAFDDETFIGRAIERAKKMLAEDKIYIVITKQQLPALRKATDVPMKQVIVQPDNADTASAVILASIYVQQQHPGDVAITLYSDHIISNPSLYYDAIAKGVDIARKQPMIVTVGTKPQFASSELGYIRRGQHLDHVRSNAYLVESFIEKPHQEKAKRLIKDNKHYWNMGLYIWRPNVLQAVVADTAPALYRHLVAASKCFGTDDFSAVVKQWYSEVEHKSFDQEISERTEQLAVLLTDIHWRDIGNWQAMYEISPKDENGTVFIGNDQADFVSAKSKNNIFFTTEKRVVVIGIEDVVLAETEEEILLCSRDHLGLIKETLKKIEPDSVD